MFLNVDALDRQFHCFDAKIRYRNLCQKPQCTETADFEVFLFVLVSADAGANSSAHRVEQLAAAGAFELKKKVNHFFKSRSHIRLRRFLLDELP